MLQNLDSRLLFSTLNLYCFTGGSLSNFMFTKLLIQLITTNTTYNSQEKTFHIGSVVITSHNYNPSIQLRFLIISPCS